MPHGDSPAEIRFSVIIPLLNEEQAIPEVLRELRQTMDALPEGYQVVLVDDGSSDGTGRLLSELALTWPQCQVERFPSPQGQAAALLAGMKWATGQVSLSTSDELASRP